MKKLFVLLLLFFSIQLFSQNKRVDLQPTITPTNNIKYVVIDANGLTKLVSGLTAKKYYMPNVSSITDFLGSSDNTAYIGSFVKESSGEYITAYIDSSGNKHSIGSNIVNQYFDGEKYWVSLNFKTINHNRLPSQPNDNGDGVIYYTVGFDTLQDFILPDTSTNYEFVNIKSDSAGYCFVNFILPTNISRGVTYTFHATGRDSVIDNGVFLNYQTASSPAINFVNNDLSRKLSYFINGVNNNENNQPFSMLGGFQMSVRYVPKTPTTGRWYFGNQIQIDR